MKTEVEDPEKVDVFKADDRGRITIGDEYANQNVRVVVDGVVTNSES